MHIPDSYQQTPANISINAENKSKSSHRLPKQNTKPRESSVNNTYTLKQMAKYK
jgi:hypothetical protein